MHTLEKAYTERSFGNMDCPDYINKLLQTFRIGNRAISGISFKVFSKQEKK